MPAVLLADLLDRGVRLDAPEAVAIAQQLIAQLTDAVDLTSEPDVSLLGPPTPSNVFVGRDGSVFCLGCQAKPAVFEMAVLLQTLLPAGTGQVSGGVRYTIARALHDVDAPPFDSIDEFSCALARYERGDRATVVRGFLARAAGETSVHAFGRPRAVPSPPMTERRRTAPAASVLRRELHAVDKRLYEQRILAARGATPSAVERRRIPPGCVAPPSNIPDILGRHALPAGRIAALGATMDLHHGPLAPRVDADVAPIPPPVIADAGPVGRWRPPAVAAILFGAIALAGVADLVHQQRSRAPERSALTVNVGVSPSRAGAGSSQRSRDDQPRGREPGHDGRVNGIAGLRHEDSARERARERETNLREQTRYARAESPPPPADQDGALVRALDDQHRPVFSPAFASSGTAMFFHTASTLATAASPDAGGDLGVMTIVDDGARNYHVQPSPDERFVAFDSDRDGERGVYVARRDGTNVRRISGAGYAAVPTWAPDGRRIAYVRAEADNPRVWNLWVQGLDEGQARRLTSYRRGQAWSASWFPDNRSVSYTHEDKLVILDVETGQAREFSSPIKGRLVRTPAVSPDGTKVIFQVFRHGAWMLDLADGSMNCVLTDPTADEFAWAPDGRRVAFHSGRDGKWGIYVLHRS